MIIGFSPSFFLFFASAASALSPFSPFAAVASGGGGFCVPSLVASLPFIVAVCIACVPFQGGASFVRSFVRSVERVFADRRLPSGPLRPV